MKIGEMNMKCGECHLIDWCGDPYEDPLLCGDRRFKNMDPYEYERLALDAENVIKIDTEDYNEVKKAIADEV